MTWTMGRDQYGDSYHNLGKYPRAALLDQLNRKHADRMFRDKKTGPPKHIGYIVAGRWITLYNVEPWERPA